LAKRKTLLNNLKQYYDISKVKRWLNNKGMDVTIRAEKLTAEQLYSLYTLLK
jgi:16S rRNA A1518/A1519 N6-dimethyltransferase RsmA/KsgA/DIM1 with predicted DNA glycosylase/AP lyase activity